MLEFERFFNAEQSQYMGFLLPAQDDIQSMGSISKFLVKYNVPLVNGIGQHNPPNDMASGPFCWVLGEENPACGAAYASNPKRFTVPVLPYDKFNDITSDAIDRPGFTNAIATVFGNEIEVCPKEIQYLQTIYYRWPNRIVVGRNPSDPQEPLEGGTGQVDPEWGDDDCYRIVDRCLFRAGVQLQSDRLVQIGLRLRQEETK